MEISVLSGSYQVPLAANCHAAVCGSGSLVRSIRFYRGAGGIWGYGAGLRPALIERGSFTRRRQGLEFTWFERASGVFAGQLPISFPSGDGEVSRVGVNRVRGPLFMIE